MGVISAGPRATEQAKGKGERGERARAGMVKKKSGRGGIGLWRWADCLPALDAPAAGPPPRSGIHTKWRHSRDEHRGRSRRKGVEGGSGWPRGRRSVTWRRAEPARPPEGRRKEPKRKGEAEERARKEPNTAEINVRLKKAGKSRGRIWVTAATRSGSETHLKNQGWSWGWG